MTQRRPIEPSESSATLCQLSNEGLGVAFFATYLVEFINLILRSTYLVEFINLILRSTYLVIYTLAKYPSRLPLLVIECKTPILFLRQFY